MRNEKETTCKDFFFVAGNMCSSSKGSIGGVIHFGYGVTPLLDTRLGRHASSITAYLTYR